MNKYHVQKKDHISTAILGRKFQQLEIILLAETKIKETQRTSNLKAIKTDLRKKNNPWKKRYSPDNRACRRIYLNFYDALGKSAKFLE